MPRTTLRIEPDLVAVTLSPLPQRVVRRSLQRQETLAAPAKLGLDARGAGLLLAEVALAGDPSASQAGARDALAEAEAWLHGTAAVPRLERAEVHEAGSIEAALERLAWPWGSGADGGYQVDVTDPGLDCRVHVRPGPHGLCVSATELPLAPRSLRSFRALQTYALSANARLRFARVSLRGAAESPSARVEAWLLAGTPADPALADLIEAVVAARAETLRPLRALCHPDLASRYAALRGPAALRVTRRSPDRHNP
jgi:hypothetical protein